MASGENKNQTVPCVPEIVLKKMILSVDFLPEKKTNMEENTHGIKRPHDEEQKNEHTPSPDSNQKNVQTFLDYVAGGREDKAEEMLKLNKELVLVTGNITDHARRTFKNITGFKYAVWALDWKMWTMIRKYLSRKAEQAQVKMFRKGEWVKDHGVHAKWEELLGKLQKCIHYHTDWDPRRRNKFLSKQIGRSQFLLPMHVLQEYCNPDRSFDPCPNFTERYTLVRELPRWLSTVISQGCFEFSLIRDRSDFAREHYNLDSSLGHIFTLDRTALLRLYNTRNRQRRQMVTEWKLDELLKSYVVSKKNNKEHPLLFDPVDLIDLVLDYVGHASLDG
jgi:hypothetical protein